MIYTIKYKTSKEVRVEKRSFKNKKEIDEYIKNKNAILLSTKLEIYDTLFKNKNKISDEEILKLLQILQSINKYTKSEAKIQQILEKFGNNDARYKDLKEILNKLAFALTQGMTVSRALEQLGIEKFIVKSIESGQQTGSLDSVYTLLIDLYKLKIETANKAKKALIMPKIILVIITLFFIGAILYFIPQIKQLSNMIDFNTLPAISQWMFNVNDYAEKHKYIFLTITILITLAVYKLIIAMVVRFAKYIPKLKDVYLAENFTIVSAILAIALTSRMQIYEAFSFASETATDRKFRADLMMISNMLEQRGLTILKALEELKYDRGNNFEKDFYNIVFMLEDSGEIEKGFLDVYKDYKTKLENTMESAVSLINPIATLIVGIVVMIIVMGAYAPIYSIGSKGVGS